MDKLGSMAILLKTVEAGSLSAAAKQLDVPLATVSRRIADLEAQLHTRLLTRSSRRFALTEAGRLYVQACKRILEQVEDAERAATGTYRDPRGKVTLTAPIVLGRIYLIPLITDFLAQYPDIDVKLVLVDRLLDLVEADVDLALRVGDLDDGNMIATKVGSVRRVTCASPSYLARRGHPRRPDDLGAHDCVSFDNLASPAEWRFATPRGETLIPIHSRLTVTTAEAAVDGAIAGLGPTRLLSYQVAPALRAGLLLLILEEYELPPWSVNLIYAGQQLLPQKVRCLLDFLTPRLRTLLHEIDTAMPEGRRWEM